MLSFTQEMVFGEMERVFKLKVRASDEDDLAIVPGMLPPANSISKQRKPIQYSDWIVQVLGMDI